MTSLQGEASRAFAPLPRASRSVFVYIMYIFLAPSSAFEGRLVGKSIMSRMYYDTLNSLTLRNITLIFHLDHNVNVVVLF